MQSREELEARVRELERELAALKAGSPRRIRKHLEDLCPPKRAERRRVGRPEREP